MSLPTLDESAILAVARRIQDQAARSQYIEQMCASNPEARVRIEAMLRASDSNPNDAQPAATVFEPPTRLAAVEGVATRIGPYKLLEKLGEGGFGIVYLAEQQQPIRRRVAVKILKPGMDTSQIVARFDAERQALALMDHANIARVLDGGETDSGRPYFVMELVKGVPITQYCNDHHLTPRQRLALFLPICHAVQHAHQKGIIHRDLKPSNVLVATQDGQPVPKVIDFGVAKALGQPLTQRTLITGLGGIIGTLEYMSPEQAEFNAVDIDTRADIYSMGVLLYELLTGSTPLTKERLQQAAMTEVLRLIREEEPPRPSTRLSDSKDSLASISAQRKREPARLTKELRGELDWIVMKCLEKDRRRRYESANAVGRDIECYLADEPVLAGPPSARYRLYKFFRRHRRSAIAAGIVLISLLVGVIGTTWGWMRAVTARRDATAAQFAEAERAEGERKAKITAQNRLAQIENGIEILGSIFTDLDPSEEEKEGKPLRVLLGERLDTAATQLEGASVGDPLAVARLQRTLGQSLLGLGSPDAALKVLNKARTTFDSDPEASVRDGLVTTLSMASANQAAGKLDLAVPLFEDTFTKMKAALGPSDPDTLDCMGDLAMAYKAIGKIDKAVPLYEQTLELMTARLGANHSKTLTITNNLAVAYQAADRLGEALPLFEQTLAKRQETLGPDHPDTIISMHSLANAYRDAGKLDKALPLFKQCLAKWQTKLGNEHPYTLACMHNTAMTLAATGEPDQALPLLREVVARSVSKHGSDHPLALVSMNQLAGVLRTVGKSDEALPLLQDVVEKSKAKLGADHPDTMIAMNSVAGALKDLRRPGEAEVILVEVVALARPKLGVAHSHTQTYLRNLADCYSKMDQPSKGEPIWRELVEFWRAKSGDDSPQYARELQSLGLNLIEQHRDGDAEPILRQSYAIRERTEPELWTTFYTASLLGAALLGQTKYAEAEPLLVTGYDGMKERELKIPKIGRPRVTEAAQRVAQLYDAWGKPDQASRWREKLQSDQPK